MESRQNRNPEEYKRPLPKNVRQIGEHRGGRKIYIEDFVITYLKRLAEPEKPYARGAILFGNVYQTEIGPVLFVDGAIEAQNLELDMDATIFNEDIWEELKAKGEHYYPGRQVAGWFLSRIGYTVEMNVKIRNIHLRNFPGKDQILYMMDPLEKEDAVYLCENQQMKRQNGYYIYYEKNQPMQEYMIAVAAPAKKEQTEQGRISELRRDKKLVNSYRKMSQYTKKNKSQNNRIRLIRAACLCLIVLTMFSVLHQLAERQEEKWWTGYMTQTVQYLTGLVTNSGTVEEETLMTDVWNPIENTEEKPEESTTREEAIQTAANPKPLYYIVEKGDTLAAISRKMYSTDKYADRIAKANQLTDADKIYEGQKILIPSME